MCAAARGEMSAEQLYKGTVPVVHACQELFRLMATLNDPRDHEAIGKVVGNQITSADIAHALVRLRGAPACQLARVWLFSECGAAAWVLPLVQVWACLASWGCLPA